MMLGIYVSSLVIALVLVFFYRNKSKFAKRKMRISNRQMRVELGKYETLFNSIQISVEYYGADGHIIDLNNKCMEMWGMVDKRVVIANGKCMFTPPFLTEEELERLRSGESIFFVRSYDFDYMREIGMFETTKTGQAVMSVNISPVKDISDMLVGYVVTAIDVTEKERYDQELEMSRIKWETLYHEKVEIIKSMPVGVAVYDKEGRTETINKVLADMCGIADMEAHIGRRISIFEDPALPEQIREQIRNGEDGDVTIEYDLGKVSRAGYYATSLRDTQLVVDVKFRTIWGSDHQIASYIFIVQDVTAQKKNMAELERLRSEAEYSLSLFNNIIEKIPLSIFIKDVDNDCRYVIVNDMLAKLQHRTPTTIIGRTDYELYSQHVADEYRDADMQAVAASGVPVRCIKPLGIDTNIIIESTEAVFTTLDQRKLLVGVVADVTERENARMELQQAKEATEEANLVLNNIIQQIPTGLYIKDIDNGFKYLIVNQKLADIHHCTVSDFIGHTVHHVVSQETVNLFIKDNEETIKRNGQAYVSVKHIEIDGVMRVHEVTQMMFSAMKGHRLIIGIVADITEKEQQRMELRQAKEQAEESDRLKSAFLANMSHEIRTPLNAIVGFSELIKDSHDEHEKDEYFKIISTNNELLLRLISDILDLSKIESGIMDFDRKEFDMATFFAEFSTSMKLKATNSKVKFITVNPYKSCTLSLDKNRLAQVLTNFVTNAIKYTPQGYIKMGYEYIDGGLRLYVKDTGIGISEAKKDRVFRRFEKLDDFAQGTGLGLSICKAIIETHDGRIGYDSTEGVGSLFWSWIPVQAHVVQFEDTERVERGIQQPEVVQAVSLPKDLRILIAEDNESNSLLLQTLLKGYSISRVANGLQAVELVQQEHFDVILMDINMPVMGGIEATQKIREFDQQIIIVAVTANVFDSDRDLAMDTGCNAFVSKPLKKNDLIYVLNQQIQSQFNS